MYVSHYVTTFGISSDFDSFNDNSKKKKKPTKSFMLKMFLCKNKSLEGMMIPGGNPINEILSLKDKISLKILVSVLPQFRFK
jgi:hypothetical protein